MIEVTPDTACVLYLGIAMMIVLGMWLFRYKKHKTNAIPYAKRHIVCEFCHTSYIDNPEKLLTRCPECQFLNNKSNK